MCQQKWTKHLFPTIISELEYWYIMVIIALTAYAQYCTLRTYIVYLPTNALVSNVTTLTTCLESTNHGDIMIIER